MRNVSLPYHFYVNVKNSFLGPNMPDGYTPAIWHGVYSRPGQLICCHVLLESGAHWSGLPLCALSTTAVFDDNSNVNIQPWGGMGNNIETFMTTYLEGLPVYVFHTGLNGRHTGIIIDWGDGYSRYPAEHKPLSLITLDCGYFALVPNNHFTVRDKHLVKEESKNNLKFYERGETVYWER
jgi:hypothetical protein